MNFLGVGPGELLLIFIITLLVVGPERLPGMARQAGRMLVRVRNWMQTSPDAALVLRARQELEQELAQIRSSLLEVQSVRDEVLDVAKQIDEAVSPITSIRPPSLTELIKEPADKPEPRTNNGQAVEAPALDEAQPAAEAPPRVASGGEAQVAQSEAQPAAPEDAPAGIEPAEVEPALDSPAEAREDAPAEVEPAAEPALDSPAEAPEAPAAAPEPAEVEPALDSPAEAPAAAPEPAAVNGAQPEPAPAALSPAEREELNLRIQALMADLHALQEQLRRRGLLDADWQPPSWSMQLAEPAPETAIEEVNR